MKKQFKPHLQAIERKRTSVGRDLEAGIRIDRNERVSNFDDAIIKQIYQHLPKHVFNTYPDTDHLYTAIAQWLNVQEEQLYITNGITEGIRIVFETLISPGDRVALLAPIFPMYNVYAKIYQAVVDPIPFEKDLTLSVQSVLKAINSTTALVCIPNPNLPIEHVFTLDEVRAIAEKCKECDAAFVVDEAYAFFGSESAIPLLRDFDNIIVFQTFSKAFGLAGIRLGYMVSTQENIEYLSKTRSLVESNGLSMGIAEFMLSHLDIMHDYVRAVKEGGDLVKKSLTEFGIRFFGGSFTNGMLIFLRDKMETDSLLSFLKERKIYIRGSFEPPIENCLRLTLGPVPQMKKFVDALKEWKMIGVNTTS